MCQLLPGTRGENSLLYTCAETIRYITRVKRPYYLRDQTVIAHLTSLFIYLFIKISIFHLKEEKDIRHVKEMKCPFIRVNM